MSETQDIEYKQSWRDEYLKWICGFANAKGGVIYIGMDDNGHVCGIEDARRLMEEIPNKVRDLLGIWQVFYMKACQEGTTPISGETTPKLPPNYPQTTPKLETDAMILQTIQSTPDITKEELAKICKISIEGVRYQIRKLRKAGRIEWVGHSRTGRWVIKENKQNDIHTNDNIQ